MKTILQLKKGIFSGNCEIFSEGTSVGKIKNSLFNESAEAEMKGKRYKFKSKGFLKQKTLIIDSDTGEEIGGISYNAWMTKGEIGYPENSASWKFTNGWNTKWRVTNAEGKQINYKLSTSKGIIETEIEDDLMILAGLYIQNYYSQATVVVMICILIPIWVTSAG